MTAPLITPDTAPALLHDDGPLSVAMRDGSRAEHEAAEGSAFMSALLAGRVDAAGYAGYLARLRSVYAAMESVGRADAADPAFAAVVDPALERLAALDADLAYWTDGAPISVVSPAADAYVVRLEQSAVWGGLFAAHHYTRYLGDLSGGQAIGRILAREFGLDRGDGGEGIAFYSFAEVAKPKLYKDAYRARLDALPYTAEEKRRVVAEVKVAFNLNQALFAELDGTLHLHRRVPLDER